MVDVIPLRYGTAFKKAFSDPEVFSAFVRDIIGVELEFTRIEQEKEFLAPVGKVDIRFDLFGEDTKHRAIVELQHFRQRDMFSRFAYYHLVAQIEQIKSSKKYEAERTVYTIVILTRLPEDEHLRFDLASQSSDLITLDGRALGLFGHRIVFVNPRAIAPTTPPHIRQWLELIEDSLDDKIDETAYPHPLMRRVIEAIVADKLSPHENYLYKEEAEWEDTKDAEFHRGKKEGRDEGLKDGLCKAIFDMCDLLDIALDESRRALLDTLSTEALEGLREEIKRNKRWPTST